MIALLVAVVLQCSTMSYSSKYYLVNDFDKLNNAMLLLKTVISEFEFCRQFEVLNNITVGQNSYLFNK